MKQLFTIFIILGIMSFAEASTSQKKLKTFHVPKAKITRHVSKSKKTQKKKSQWNQVCRSLLNSSVRSTLKLGKSFNKKKKVSRNKIESQIQDELLVVQLNAWVCRQSVSRQKGLTAEEMFLKEYSKKVQSRKL